ncbi:MAG: hypothetical protein V4471_04290 [Pseudomonadota bacterium]
MKFLRIGFRLFIGTMSILILAACGGGSGGPGGATGAAGSGGLQGAPGAPGAAGPIGLSLNTTGGINVSADLLRAEGIDVRLLNPQQLAQLRLRGIVPLDARVLERNGNIIGIQLPNGRAFSLPGAGPTVLPGIGALPSLPAGGAAGGGGLRGTLNNLTGGLRR